MSRHSFTSNCNRHVSYGYDRQLSEYFIEVRDDEEPDNVESFSTSPITMFSNHTVYNKSQILEKLTNLGCTDEDHLYAIALDRPIP